MRRSEMIKLLQRELCHGLQIYGLNPAGLEHTASDLLDAVEEAGMLPPQRIYKVVEEDFTYRKVPLTDNVWDEESEKP